MPRQEFMDFSMETDFQEKLLERIKDECFGALSDEDLEFVNAAGVTLPWNLQDTVIPGILLEQKD